MLTPDKQALPATFRGQIFGLDERNLWTGCKSGRLWRVVGLGLEGLLGDVLLWSMITVMDYTTIRETSTKY